MVRFVGGKRERQGEWLEDVINAFEFFEDVGM